MTNRVCILGVIPVLVATAALGAITGIAKTGHLGAPAPPGAGKQAPAVQAAKPSGYVIVFAVYSAPNGQRAGGDVACPATTKGAARYPLGGGVLIGSDSLSANVDSSYPSGISWVASVKNNSGADTSFTVYAICAKPHKNYQQVFSNGLYAPPGSQTSAFVAACPSGTRVTGGGGFNDSPDLAVNINSSSPSGNGWQIRVNNGSAGGDGAYSYAVCSASWGATTGYNLAIGPVLTAAPGTETLAEVSCPSGQSVLGGGGFSDTESTAVNMNSTGPDGSGTGWDVYENNASGSNTSIIAYAICAT